MWIINQTITMNIPSQVMNAASELRSMYGEHVEYLGEFQGAQAYYYHYPDDVTAGVCPVYLYDGTTVDEVTGDIAMNILDSLIEDVDEVGVE